MISIEFNVIYIIQLKTYCTSFGFQCTPEQISTDLLQELNFQLEQDKDLQTVS